MTKNTEFIVESNEHEQRIDIILSGRYQNYSRSFFARLIKDQHIAVNNVVCKKAGKVISSGDRIIINFPQKEPVKIEKNIDSINISVIFEHEQFLIINKPAGIIVHESAKKSEEMTLVDWLLCHYPDLASVGYSGRPGIVHRLDKDTSGIMIIPKTPFSHTYFSNLFKNRAIKKEYLALIVGIPQKMGTIDFPIGRDQKYRTKMKAFGTTTQKRPTTAIRQAKTHFVVHRYFDNQYSYIIARPETGRTHQIRVHCAASGFPILGDSVYGNTSTLISRQALHAHSLSFSFQNQEYSFSVDIPEDMQHAIQKLSTTTDSSQ